MLAEQAFYQVAMIIEDKDHRFQSIARELANFLGGLLMGTFPRDQDGPSLWGSHGCSKGGWRCRSVSAAQFSGVIMARAHTTGAARWEKRSNSPLPRLWCT